MDTCTTSLVGYCNELTWTTKSLKPEYEVNSEWFTLHNKESRRRGTVGFWYVEDEKTPGQYIGTIEFSADQEEDAVPTKSYYVEFNVENVPEMGMFLLPLTECDAMHHKSLISWMTSFHFNVKLPEEVTFYCKVVEYPMELAVHSPDIPSIHHTFRLVYKQGMKYSDVKLKIGDDTLKAHKAVLIVRSEFFKEYFEDNPTSDIVDICFTTDLETLQSVLKYIYTGLITIEPNNVYDILYTSHKLKLYHLKGKCEKYLIVNMNVDNVIETLDICYLEPDPSILNREIVMNFIEAHEDELVTKPEFEEFWKRSVDSSNVHYVLKVANKYNMDTLRDEAMDCVRSVPSVIERPEFKDVLSDPEITKALLINFICNLDDDDLALITATPEE